MQLVEAGKLSLGNPVCQFIEEFNTDMHRNINIMHLLTHTSGIAPDPGYFFEPYAWGWWDRLHAQELQGYPEEHKVNWIKAMISGPVRNKPGKEWAYCTAGFTLLGEIISRVSGMECEQYIIEKIIKPLGLNNTFFDVPEDLHSRVCHTHEWSEKRLSTKEDRTGKPPRTGGGLYSTLHDLNSLGQMTLKKGFYNGEHILGRKSIEYMIKNHLRPNTPAFGWGSDNTDFHHGLGFNLTLSDFMSPSTYNHEGAGRSMLYIDPEEDLVLSAFVPSNNDWVAEAVVNTRSIVWSGLL